MVETKSAAEQFAEQRAREAISQRYIDPATLDPARQDQIDRNRIPGEYSAPFHPSDYEDSTARPARVVAAESSLAEAIRQKPLQAMVIAAVIGFAVSLLRR